MYHASHTQYSSQTFGFIPKCGFWPSVSLRLHLFALEKVQPAWAQYQIFLSVKLVFLVLSPDPLRSGQGRRHPLQHHRSRRWSAPEWDLQHRPHQWQYVCDPTPRQGGESLFPCKEEICVSASPLAPFVSVSLSPPPPLFILRPVLSAEQPQVGAHSDDSPYCTVPSHQSLWALIDAEASSEMMNPLAKHTITSTVI